MKFLPILVFCLGFAGMGQASELFYPLDALDGLSSNMVVADISSYQGESALHVTMVEVSDEDYVTDGPNFVWLPLDFQNGVIEVEMAAYVSPEDMEWGARGFIGLAFRIGDDFQFEGVYLRPTNGRSEDQVRRNHSTQYFSHPDYPWYVLRENFPEMYESYVDLVLGQWTKVRIEVAGEKARLFVHDAEQPCLVVNDLKLGADARGGVGLWVDAGTQGYFRNLKITQN